MRAFYFFFELIRIVLRVGQQPQVAVDLVQLFEHVLAARTVFAAQPVQLVQPAGYLVHAVFVKVQSVEPVAQDDAEVFGFIV